MPKLWNETIEAHRRAVTEATLDATAALVTEHGLAAVTMSRIAAATGIGRATLYKYFPDLQAILAAWHERHVAAHIAQLTAVRDRGGPPEARLEAVLRAFATISHHRGDSGLAALLHRGPHIVRAQRDLSDLVQGLLAECVATGAVRDDVAPAELASYCLHALSAAANLPSKAAVDRLVTVTLAGLRPGA